jgi:hypothetical protein
MTTRCAAGICSASVACAAGASGGNHQTFTRTTGASRREWCARQHERTCHPQTRNQGLRSRCFYGSFVMLLRLSVHQLVPLSVHRRPQLRLLLRSGDDQPVSELVVDWDAEAS